MKTMEELLAHEGIHLDDEQIAAVHADGNVVVSAGAGSGKTTVLSYRFLRLMLDGIDCDKILALTFTNKAAREMQGRIGVLLSRLASAEDLDGETHLFLLDQVKNHFPKATICTLDSFCSSILRSDSLRYGITADFTIDEDKVEESCASVAREMLWNVRADKGAEVLARQYRSDDLLSLLASYAKNDFNLPLRFPEDASGLLIAHQEKNIAEGKAVIVSYLEGVRDFGRREEEKGSSALKVLAVALRFADSLSRGEGWDEFLRDGSSWGMKKAARAKSGSLGEFIRDGFDAYREACKRVLCSTRLLERKEDFSRAFAFLRSYGEACAKEKRRSGVLCFKDVASLANDILTTNPPLRAWYGEKFRAIMVDEFQDNNSQQRDLLFLLAAKPSFTKKEVPQASDLLPDKLFFVGDEKQSIYRFRGADVSVFKALSEEFPSARPILMETNYRSEPFLISQFTKIFSAMMAEASEKYEALFHELHARAGEGKDPSTLTLLVKMPKEEAEGGERDSQDEEASDSESEAHACVSLLREMMESDAYLVRDAESGTLRHPRPNDFAILMATTSHQMNYEKALKQADLPYTIAATPRSLMLEAPANDLYSLLQLCVYSDDRVAYLATLRSPFCALADEEAARVMKKDLPPFSPEASGDERYRDACRFFARLKEASATLPLPSLLRMAWMEGGYRMALLCHPNFQAYLSHYDDLYHFAEREQEKGSSLATFLSHLRPFLGTSNRVRGGDEEVIREAREGVHILTFHRSKGLQFPIVFVVELGAKQGSAVKDVYGRLPRCGAVKVPLSMDPIGPPFLKDKDNFISLLNLRDDESLLEIAERKRLLYVAMTRAERHLVLSGRLRKPKSGESGNTFLDLILPTLSLPKMEEGTYDGVSVRFIADVPRSALMSSRSYSSVPPRLIDAYYGGKRREIDARPSRLAATLFAPEGEHGEHAVLMEPLPSDALLREKDLSADWGTFVHALVMHDMGCLEPEGKAEDFLPASLRALPERERRVLLDSASLLSARFLSSEFYLREVKPYKIQGEARFFSREEKDGMAVAVEGAIDVLIDRGEGRWDVIDFKTDRLKESSVHRGQLELYRRAVERITGGVVRSAVVYLRDPSDVVWWS